MFTLNPFSVNVYNDSPFEFMGFMDCLAAILSILKFLQRPSEKSSYGSLFLGFELLSITFAHFSLQSLYNLKVRFHEALSPILVLECWRFSYLSNHACKWNYLRFVRFFPNDRVGFIGSSSE